jgi:hypothetical protein
VSELVLALVDLVVLAWLVSTYLRLRGRLAGVTASVTAAEVAGSDDHEADLVATGVVRSGHLAAMFAVIEIDADRLHIRSRPRWLGLEVVVPRGDVAGARAATNRSGRPTFFVFEPVAGRAAGLEQLRVLLRRDPVGFRRRLVQLGWLVDGDPTTPAGRDPDATLGSAG